MFTRQSNIIQVGFLSFAFLVVVIKGWIIADPFIAACSEAVIFNRNTDACRFICRKTVHIPCNIRWSVLVFLDRSRCRRNIFKVYFSSIRNSCFEDNITGCRGKDLFAKAFHKCLYSGSIGAVLIDSLGDNSSLLHILDIAVHCKRKNLYITVSRLLCGLPHGFHRVIAVTGNTVR